MKELLIRALYIEMLIDLATTTIARLEGEGASRHDDSYFYYNEGRDQIASVTRLMARLGFPDNDIVDNMISDFSRSKDLQV